MVGFVAFGRNRRDMGAAIASTVSKSLLEGPHVHRNLSTPQLVEAAIARGEARLASNGAVVALTGERTGRSPRDKFLVKDALTESRVDWGQMNQPFQPDRFAALLERVQHHMQERDRYVLDLYAGADAHYRLPITIVAEYAWHALFVKQLFVRPQPAELAEHLAEFTVIAAPEFDAVPERDGTTSSTFIITDFTRKIVLIGGTKYAGEMKKSIFGVMNYLLPERDVFPMHCSANVGADGKKALFFGLSGTGKTTLSADPHRRLIGDDEHGWGERGVFNFEGGCYAKVINLSAEAEPEIWAASHRFGTVLENVVADAYGRLDLTDQSLTENTRSAYPVEYIPNIELSLCGGQPRNVVMLTCDAFGVMPPIAKLTPAQAMYHFLSGYTALVAGTEKGLGAEPAATFSTCFGAPFLPRRPEVYGRMLAELIARHEADCWLVNTGWSGGQYGVGSRVRVRHTRALLRAALDGSLVHARFRRDAFFGLSIPE